MSDRSAPAGLAPSETQFVADGPVVAAPAEPVPQLGRYRLIAQLGAGTSGAVYRAHDDVLDRLVAIKALHAHADVAVRARFLHEARAIGTVLHPNILAVYDAATTAEPPYLVMELARGSLRDRMTSGALDVELVRRIGIQIARALVAAHAANIVHRDVKPANILAGDGEVWKLADFGIAKLPDSTLTTDGQFLGSPSYAAPESLRTGTFSAASDVYGLGATLYEAIAGTPPHGDHDMPSVVRKLEHDPLPLTGAVDPALAALIMATLSRDPAARPSAAALAAQLAAWPAACPAACPEVSRAPAPTEAAPRAAGRSASRRVLAGTAIGLAVIATILLVIATQRRRRPASDPETTSSSAPASVSPPPADLPAADLPAADPPAADPPAPVPIDPYAGDPAAATDPEPPTEPTEPPVASVDPDVTPDETFADPTFGAPLAGAGGGFGGEPGLDDDTANRMLRELERDARSEVKRLGPRRRGARGRRWRDGR